MDLPTFRQQCEAEPDDEATRLVLADWLEERGDPRARVLRAACAVRGRVGATAFPDQADAFWDVSESWGVVGERLEGLAERPEGGEDVRGRCDRLLRGDVPLDSEDLKRTLRFQYDQMVSLLDSGGLLDGSGEQRFITAIDGKEYPLPSFEAILARLQAPALQAKLRQGFDTLLLVPFGLDLQRLIEAWRQGLRANAGRVEALHNLNWQTPVWVWDGYTQENLVYFPRRFAADHGGRTKAGLLAADPAAAWQVLLVEGALAELPRQGLGRTLAGRRQIECGRSPQEYLADFPQDEVGWTPETYIVRFLDTLRRQGTILDRETLSYLTAAYLSASGYVPTTCWDPRVGRAHLAGDHPGIVGPDRGARAAVRVA